MRHNDFPVLLSSCPFKSESLYVNGHFGNTKVVLFVILMIDDILRIIQKTFVVRIEYLLNVKQIRNINKGLLAKNCSICSPWPNG